MKECKKLSVSQLNSYIKSVFDDELILHNICVYGELNQLNVREGNSYFTLTEGSCYINCVMFSTVEKLEIGTKILAVGRVNFYSKTGKINFAVKHITVLGQGNLQNELNLLKDKLSKEGLFQNRPQPPVYINDLAVITSETGAVIHDIMSVIKDKDIDIGLTLYSTTVQGDNAEREILNALEKVNKNEHDVVIIARGGGSSCDLDVFNSEKLARATALSKVPVISAIGHETDYTLCDFCAGKRAGTPSIAAGIVANINIEFFARLDTALQRINRGTENLYAKRFSKFYYSANAIVHAMDKHVGFDSLKITGLNARVSTAIGRLAKTKVNDIFDSQKRLNMAVDRHLFLTEQRFKSVVSSVECASPLKILSKGYTKVTKNGKYINSSKQLKKSDAVDLMFKDGNAVAEIIGITNFKG